MSPKTIATIVVACIIAIPFIAVVLNEIIKKKKGKPSCSCGGNCGACGICPNFSKKENCKETE